MIVCKDCREFGHVVHTKQKTQKRSSYTYSLQPTPYEEKSRKVKYVEKSQSYKPKFKKRTPRIEDLELIEDYRKVLKKLRQKKNMTLPAFAASIGIAGANYRSIEAGKVELLIQDAKKIEKKFNISITRVAEEYDYDETLLSKKPQNYTLGDMYKKKDRKK